jgi:hypothetical protein
MPGEHRRDESERKYEEMDPQQMAEWAYSHACDKCHAGEPCEMDACLNAQEVTDFLKRVERVDTTDAQGNALKGWLVRDQI